MRRGRARIKKEKVQASKKCQNAAESANRQTKREEGRRAKQQKGKIREEREVKNGRKGEVDKENKKG
jgi:hypothetical protein